MIQIVRPEAPEYMGSDRIRNAKEKLLKIAHNSERMERMRFEPGVLIPLRPFLMEMCSNKCAYCESELGVVASGDIDNFRPKGGARGFNREEYAPGHYWWLAYEWENLMIACQICNQKYKRDFFPVEHESLRAPVGAIGMDLLKEQPLLIDPTWEDPSEHLVFEESGFVLEQSKKGKVTIEILGLNRQELVFRRLRAADQLKDRLKLLKPKYQPSVGQQTEIVAYINDLFSERPRQEFAGMLRATFEKWRQHNDSYWQTLQSSGAKPPASTHPGSRKAMSSSEAEEIRKVDLELTQIKRFSIKSIEIKNFKSIADIKLELLPAGTKDDRESWLLLLGDNGIGKSSILQAIALTLAGKKQLDKLKPDVTDFLKRGEETGFVRITGNEHDLPVELHFDRNGFRPGLDEAPTFVLAYGSTRLLPKGNIAPDQDKEPYMNVRNLFDYSVALNDPAKWLCQVDDAEFRERVGPAFFDVLALRGDDKLWISEGIINIRRYGENYELEDNSDGYKTIVALVSDIMQTLSLDKANYHNAQGIVLIDEIGNHLHPRWRMKIVGALRRAFPKLQFIVTTHEPLCLRGLAHGEVGVLVRDRQHSMRVLDRSLLPDHNLMNLEQLLTSDLFGLINVLDEDTEKTYEEYYGLLSKKEEDQTEEDKGRIREMAEMLSEKEVLGNTPMEQALYRLINNTMAKKLLEDGFKTREALKTETVHEVTNLLQTKKISWL